ncbi:MAG: glycosyl transferase [Hyphomonadaceae bacterium]|nr:glycosyl transferase [Clostridia bacterium]
MNKIPKIIHYCWFGKSPLTPLAKKCIRSWKKYCPDFKIMEWNEENFDIHSNLYVKQAYEAKKWAFVTDYVRLYALQMFGGIYMDTDVEVIKKIDVFLSHNAFLGFEEKDHIATAIMGAEKGSKWVERFLEYYKNKSFINEDNSFDMTTNVITITRIMRKHYNLQLDNTLQELEGGLVLYPQEFFCPKDFFTGKINKTQNTYTIHHFNGSWHDNEERLLRKLKYIFGIEIGSKFYAIFCSVKKNGILNTISKVIKYAKDARKWRLH